MKSYSKMQSLFAIVLPLLLTLIPHLADGHKTIEPVCGDIYGKPASGPCMEATSDLRRRDRRDHFYSLARVAIRPDSVTLNQWRNRVRLPVIVPVANRGKQPTYLVLMLGLNLPFLVHVSFLLDLRRMYRWDLSGQTPRWHHHERHWHI